MTRLHVSETVVGYIQPSRRCACGIAHARPQHQAFPATPEPMPVIRLVNYGLAALIVWMFIIGWGLTLAHGAGWIG